MINDLHKRVWERFVRMPEGHLLDYAGYNGEVIYPTAEECRTSNPNALGWWTPIENGAFFGGLYAYALIKEYNRAPSKQALKEIKILMDGLYLLEEVGQVDGFIARGVADDGKSHFPFSSDDQVFPWVRAVYAYSKSRACADKADAECRLLRVLRAIRSYGWNIPTDVKGLFRGNSLTEHSDWRNVTGLLQLAAILADITKSAEDWTDFERLADGIPQGSIFTRAEIASHGYAVDMIASLGTKQTWICLGNHLGLEILAKLDLKRRDYYIQGMEHNGITALNVISDMNKYDNSKEGFDVNWRRICERYEDWNGDTKLAVKIAMKELELFDKDIAPHRQQEQHVLGNALFAAWISVTSPDKRVACEAYKRLIKNVANVDWDSLHLPYAFVAESAILAAKQFQT